jgi:hypothetical protein
MSGQNEPRNRLGNVLAWLIIGYVVVGLLVQCDEPYTGSDCVSLSNGAEWGDC